jgi:hypothetical protein
MTLFRGSKGLKRVKVDELSDIAGNDWATVWRKLEIDPHLRGASLIGELRIGGKWALPIMARLGYSNREDVIYMLCEALGLSEAESLEFLGCTLGKDSVIVKVEEMLVSYPDGSE